MLTFRCINFRLIIYWQGKTQETSCHRGLLFGDSRPPIDIVFNTDKGLFIYKLSIKECGSVDYSNVPFYFVREFNLI